MLTMAISLLYLHRQYINNINNLKLNAMKRTLLLAALLTLTALFAFTQETKKVEKDGFVWYKTSAFTNGVAYEGALDANKKTIIPANKYQSILYYELEDETTKRIVGHYFSTSIIKDYVSDGIVMLDGTVVYEANKKYNAVSYYSALDGNLLYVFPHQMGINLTKKELELWLKDPVTGRFKRIAYEKTGEFSGVSYDKGGYFMVFIDDDRRKYYDIFGDFLHEGKYMNCRVDKVIEGFESDGKVILNTSIAEYNVKKCAEKYAKYKKSNPEAAATYCRLAAFFINDVDASVVGNAEFVAQLGFLFEKGEAVSCNMKKAKELYDIAKKAGYAPAGDMLKVLEEKDKPITIEGDLPPGVKDVDLYFLSEADLLKYAQQGYLIPIREYCKQRLFFTYGTTWYNETEKKVIIDEKTVRQITDKEASDVEKLLVAGATKDASCQFMLACLYTGMKCLNINTDLKVFSYTDVAKAKSYISMFQANPKRKEADCFGQPQVVVEWISNNIKKL